MGIWPPELIRPRLVGRVFNHPEPELSDGDEICTSALLEFFAAKSFAKTSNRIYLLGAPLTPISQQTGQLDLIRRIFKKWAECTERG